MNLLHLLCMSDKKGHPCIICKAYDLTPSGEDVFFSRIYTSTKSNLKIKLCSNHSRDLFLLGEQTFQKKFMKVSLKIKGLTARMLDDDEDDLYELLEDKPEKESKPVEKDELDLL
jgi:hypothetical protein